MILIEKYVRFTFILLKYFKKLVLVKTVKAKHFLDY